MVSAEEYQHDRVSREVSRLVPMREHTGSAAETGRLLSFRHIPVAHHQFYGRSLTFDLLHVMLHLEIKTTILLTTFALICDNIR